MAADGAAPRRPLERRACALRAAALACIATTLLACSGNPEAEEAVLVDGEALSVRSEAGRATAVIESESGAIVEGSNAFHVEFVPAVTELVNAKLFMPVHAHGSPVSPEVKPADAGYRLGNVVFNMAGAWDVRLGVTVGDAADSVTFTVDVP